MLVRKSWLWVYKHVSFCACKKKHTHTTFFIMKMCWILIYDITKPNIEGSDSLTIWLEFLRWWCNWLNLFQLFLSCWFSQAFASLPQPNSWQISSGLIISDWNTYISHFLSWKLFKSSSLLYGLGWDVIYTKSISKIHQPLYSRSLWAILFNATLITM